MDRRRFFTLFLLALLPISSWAVLPRGVVELYDSPSASTSYQSWLASQAFFGPSPPMANRNGRDSDSPQIWKLQHVNSLLCDSSPQESWHNAILVIPRGNCSYQHKAWVAQQGGAAAVLIYNTLQARYTLNTTSGSSDSDNNNDQPSSLEDVIWPSQYYDYDCSKGQAQIPAADLSFDPLPYNAEQNDPLLSGTTNDNLCRLHSSDQLRHCQSNRCYLTGNATETTRQACCAWDLHLYLYPDNQLSNVTIQIPSLFLTMQQGQELLDLLQSRTVYGTVAARWKLEYNLSGILIWALGVVVAALGAYLSASDTHAAIRYKLETFRLSPQRSSSSTSTGNARPSPVPPHRSPLQEETLELQPIHALGFIVMASSSLFILFYFKIYAMVKVFYAFGCSNAVIQVLLTPVAVRVLAKLHISNQWVYKARGPDPCIPSLCTSDILAMLVGYTWGVVWLYMALTIPHPSNTFFWMTQNIFGTCMCILFLGIIQLNTIQVAAVLLIVAFLYDIFFVFLTPYFFGGKSIMITVATSGGPPVADELWCEKYPHDPNCQGGDPLPMLLTIPRLFDYEGGSSLLGLGDIVLPGLLLSFGARLDAAKRLVAIVSGDRDVNGIGTYFLPLVVAYAIGLAMANTAVYMFHMGQPALLYLVPSCLGTMCYLGWKRSELRQLWEGPKVLETAEQIATTIATPPATTTNMQGSSSRNNPNSSSVVELSPKSSTIQEMVDDEVGTMPLLNPSPPPPAGS